MVIREMNMPLLNLHGNLFWKNTKTRVCFTNEDFHIFVGTRILIPSKKEIPLT